MSRKKKTLVIGSIAMTKRFIGSISDGERKWQPTLKTYKRQKAGFNAQALIWDVLDDGTLSWDLA